VDRRHAGNVNNREELAQFLRNRRARLRPPDVGLPDGSGRRTPGLRRQEVAELAAISIDYYIRLEQARGPKPSRQVLGALARALLLTADERAYMFDLAGEAHPPTGGPSREVPRAVRNLLASLTETPAYVMDAKYEVLAWNDLAVVFIGDMAKEPPERRNVIRWMFMGPDSAKHWNEDQSLAFARSSVADLRAAAARYPHDRGVQDLVAELLACSPRFAGLWSDHDVEVRRAVTKHIEHPQLGTLEIDCQVLHIPDTDQRLVIYTAPLGTPLHDALKSLRATLA